MWCHDAKQRCPGLQVLAYDFVQYEDVSKAVLKILHRSSSLYQPVSCDEAYLEFPAGTDGAAVAARLRAEILV
jgi:DNA repair protein REV1